MRPIGTIDDAWRRLVIPSLFIIASWMKRWMKPLSMNDDDDANENLDSLSYQLTSNESKDRVVLIYGDRIQVRKKDLKKRDSHICDMQALQPLPAPTNTANIAPAMTTSGGQPPLPVSETV
ncbi:hypothetical protein HN011_004356 [Eciton burchellii]|nr:hypothetical protein HN011_004356 [Eciton burchellii]